MSEDVYLRLREFMDKLPAGYPATPTGVEIRILKKLFTPEQAELALKLSSEPEEVQTIAARTGLDQVIACPDWSCGTLTSSVSSAELPSASVAE